MPTLTSVSGPARVLSDLDPTTVAAAFGVLAMAVLVLAVRTLRAPASSRRRQVRTRPGVGDVWWAQIPFEDGTGSKDRPCLVVETHGLRAVVLYVTSTDKTGRPGWVAMPREGWGRGTGTSWLRTDRRVVLDPDRFRRYAGPCPPKVRVVVGI